MGSKGTLFVTGILGFVLLGCSGGNTSNPGQATVGSSLVAAVRGQGGRSAEGHETDLLCRLAAQHVSSMASSGSVSHNGFQERSEVIVNAGGSDPGEILAYTSVTDESRAASACVELWLSSPGHRRIMESPSQNYCYAMATGRDGVYCMGLIANGLQ